MKIFLIIFCIFAINWSAFSQASNFCNDATPILSVDSIYGITSTFYTPFISATDSTDEDNLPLGTVFCGSIENNGWFQFEAVDTHLEIDVSVFNCSQGLGIQMEIFYTEDCFNFSSMSNCENTGTETDFSIFAENLIPGTTYYIMVDGQAGDVCEYNFNYFSFGAFGANAGEDVFLCHGQGTQLSASGGSTFLWSPSYGLSNPNISNPWAQPDTTTTYVVSVGGINPLSPYYSDTVTIFVDSCDCTAIAGVDHSIIGYEFDLEAIVNSGDYNYFWECNDTTVVFSDSANPNSTVTVIEPGNYYFVWTITNESDSVCSDIVHISFDTLLTSTFSHSMIHCRGDTVTYYYTGNGDGTEQYYWDFPGAEIISGEGQGPIMVYWPNPGEYYVSLHVVSPELSSDTSFQYATIPDILSIEIDPGEIYCEGNPSVGFSINTSGGYGGYEYEWSNGTGTPFYAGNYYVTVTDDYGCFSVDSFTIAEPTGLSVEVFAHDESYPGANNGFAWVVPSGGVPNYIYFWSNDEYTDTINNLSSGDYYVTVYDQNGCHISGSVFVGVGSMIEETNLGNFKIYPNPTKDNITIEIFDFDIKNIEIRDVIGKCVYTSPIEKRKLLVNLSEINKGSYFVILEGNNKKFVEKLTLE